MDILPEELLVNILMRLDEKDKWNVAILNKYYRNIILNYICIKNLHFNSVNISKNLLSFAKFIDKLPLENTKITLHLEYKYSNVITLFSEKIKNNNITCNFKLIVYNSGDDKQFCCLESDKYYDFWEIEEDNFDHCWCSFCGECSSIYTFVIDIPNIDFVDYLVLNNINLQKPVYSSHNIIYFKNNMPIFNSDYLSLARTNNDPDKFLVVIFNFIITENQHKYFKSVMKKHPYIFMICNNAAYNHGTLYTKNRKYIIDNIYYSGDKSIKINDYRDYLNWDKGIDIDKLDKLIN